VTVVRDEVRIPLDLRRLTDGGVGSQTLEQLTHAEARRPFDLAVAPLVRATGIIVAPDRHRLVMVVHHIIADAWSVAILVGELAALYRAFAAGRPSPLPPLDLQYLDYCAWLEERLTPDLVERQLAYWRQTLADAPDPPELPGDRARSTLATPRGGQHTFIVDADTSSRL